MDNITHTLIGVGVARAGLSQRFGRGTTLVLAVASNLTDLDIFGRFFNDGPSFLYRRMLTHSLFGVPVMAVLAAWMFGRFYKNQNFKTLFGLCLLGMGLHVLFDLMNSYGVVVFYPISRARFEFSSLFIIDLALWAMLLLPLLFWPWRDRLYKIVMIAVGIYTLASLGSRMMAQHHLKNWVERENRRPSFTYVFPEAFGNHRFRGVVKENDTYDMMLIHTLTGHIGPSQTFVTQEAAPDMRTVRQTDRAKQLEWFFKAPVWRRGENGNGWDVFDLRFMSVVIGRKTPFVYHFEDIP